VGINAVFYVLVLTVTVLATTRSISPLLLDVPLVVMTAASLLVALLFLCLGNRVISLARDVLGEKVAPVVVCRLGLVNGTIVALFGLRTAAYVMAVAESWEDEGDLVLSEDCGYNTAACNLMAAWLPELIPCWLMLLLFWTPENAAKLVDSGMTAVKATARRTAVKRLSSAAGLLLRSAGGSPTRPHRGPGVSTPLLRAQHAPAAMELSPAAHGDGEAEARSGDEGDAPVSEDDLLGAPRGASMGSDARSDTGSINAPKAAAKGPPPVSPLSLRRPASTRPGPPPRKPRAAGAPTTGLALDAASAASLRAEWSAAASAAPRAEARPPKHGRWSEAPRWATDEEEEDEAEEERAAARHKRLATDGVAAAGPRAGPQGGSGPRRSRQPARERLGSPAVAMPVHPIWFIYRRVFEQQAVGSDGRGAACSVEEETPRWALARTRLRGAPASGPHGAALSVGSGSAASGGSGYVAPRLVTAAGAAAQQGSPRRGAAGAAASSASPSRGGTGSGGASDSDVADPGVRVIRVRAADAEHAVVAEVMRRWRQAAPERAADTPGSWSGGGFSAVKRRRQREAAQKALGGWPVVGGGAAPVSVFPGVDVHSSLPLFILPERSSASAAAWARVQYSRPVDTASLGWALGPRRACACAVPVLTAPRDPHTDQLVVDDSPVVLQVCVSVSVDLIPGAVPAAVRSLFVTAARRPALTAAGRGAAEAAPEAEAHPHGPGRATAPPAQRGAGPARARGGKFVRVGRTEVSLLGSEAEAARGEAEMERAAARRLAQEAALRAMEHGGPDAEGGSGAWQPFRVGAGRQASRGAAERRTIQALEATHAEAEFAWEAMWQERGRGESAASSAGAGDGAGAGRGADGDGDAMSVLSSMAGEEDARGPSRRGTQADLISPGAAAATVRGAERASFAVMLRVECAVRAAPPPEAQAALDRGGADAEEAREAGGWLRVGGVWIRDQEVRLVLVGSADPLAAASADPGHEAAVASTSGEDTSGSEDEEEGEEGEEQGSARRRRGCCGRRGGGGAGRDAAARGGDGASPARSRSRANSTRRRGGPRKKASSRLVRVAVGHMRVADLLASPGASLQVRATASQAVAAAALAAAASRRQSGALDRAASSSDLGGSAGGTTAGAPRYKQRSGSHDGMPPSAAGDDGDAFADMQGGPDGPSSRPWGAAADDAASVLSVEGSTSSSFWWAGNRAGAVSGDGGRAAGSFTVGLRALKRGKAEVAPAGTGAKWWKHHRGPAAPGGRAVARGSARVSRWYQFALEDDAGAAAFRPSTRRWLAKTGARRQDSGDLVRGARGRRMGSPPARSAGRPGAVRAIPDAPLPRPALSGAAVGSLGSAGHSPGRGQSWADSKGREPWGAAPAEAASQRQRILVVEEDLRESPLTWAAPAAALSLLLPLRRARLAAAQRALQQLKEAAPRMRYEALPEDAEDGSRSDEDTSGLSEWNDTLPAAAAAPGGAAGGAGVVRAMEGGPLPAFEGGGGADHLAGAIRPSRWRTFRTAMSCRPSEVLGAASPWSSSFSILQRRIRASTDRQELQAWLEEHVAEVQEAVRAMEAAAGAGRGGGVGPEGITFKPSVSRDHAEVQFFPVNLHVQEMRVRVIDVPGPLTPAAQRRLSVAASLAERGVGSSGGGGGGSSSDGGGGGGGVAEVAMEHAVVAWRPWAETTVAAAAAADGPAADGMAPFGSPVMEAGSGAASPRPDDDEAAARSFSTRSLSRRPSGAPFLGMGGGSRARGPASSRGPASASLASSLGAHRLVSHHPPQSPNHARPGGFHPAAPSPPLLPAASRGSLAAAVAAAGATGSATSSRGGSARSAGAPLRHAVSEYQEVIYDTVTVGAFAAHTLKFKKGGMRSEMARLLAARRRLARTAESLPTRGASGPEEMARLRSSVTAWREARRGSFGLAFLLPTGSQDEATLNHAAMAAAEARWRCERRSDVLLTQAVGALATAFGRKLRLLQRHMRPADGRKLLRQYASAGFLFAVESLLTASGKELSMLEDFETAVAMMRGVAIRLLPPTVPEGATKAAAKASASASARGVVIEEEEEEEDDDDDDDAEADDRARAGAGVVAAAAPSSVSSGQDGPMRPELGSAPQDWQAGGGGSVRMVWEEGEDGARQGRMVLEIRMWPAGDKAPGAGEDHEEEEEDDDDDDDDDEEEDEEEVDSGEDAAREGGEAAARRAAADAAWPAGLRRLVPASLRRGGCVEVCPALFTQGVNEFQTLANLQESVTFGLSGEASGMQRRINGASLQVLAGYVTRWQARYEADTRRVEAEAEALREAAAADGATLADAAEAEAEAGLLEEEARGRRVKVRAVSSSLARASQLIKASSATKALRILTLASSVARSVHGGRVTSCKSAKDRTSMLVTLEQESLITSVHGPVRRATRQRVRDMMRRFGVRIRNAGKNTGKAKFAFNPLQIVCLPEPLRPPAGTGGNKAT